MRIIPSEVRKSVLPQSEYHAGKVSRNEETRNSCQEAMMSEFMDLMSANLRS